MTRTALLFSLTLLGTTAFAGGPPGPGDLNQKCASSSDCISHCYYDVSDPCTVRCYGLNEKDSERAESMHLTKSQEKLAGHAEACKSHTTVYNYNLGRRESKDGNTTERAECVAGTCMSFPSDLVPDSDTRQDFEGRFRQEKMEIPQALRKEIPKTDRSCKTKDECTLVWNGTSCFQLAMAVPTKDADALTKKLQGLKKKRTPNQPVPSCVVNWHVTEGGIHCTEKFEAACVAGQCRSTCSEMKIDEKKACAADTECAVAVTAHAHGDGLCNVEIRAARSTTAPTLGMECPLVKNAHAFCGEGQCWTTFHKKP